MMAMLLNANAICEAARQRGVALTEADIAAFGTLYDGVLREGERCHPEAPRPNGKRGRTKQSPAFNLLSRMRLHADAVLLFIKDPTVPFTNNLGERAVRMPKVKQKISGCFRSAEGAAHFGVIRSCLDTFHKQGHGMFEVLRHAFAGTPLRPAAA